MSNYYIKKKEQSSIKQPHEYNSNTIQVCTKVIYKNFKKKKHSTYFFFSKEEKDKLRNKTKLPAS